MSRSAGPTTDGAFEARARTSRTGPRGVLALATRAQFLQAMALACRDAAGTLAVLRLDLARFRSINAAFGHAFGDSVLRALGIRLRTGLDDALALAHLSGDDFAVLVPVDDAASALAAAQRLRVLLQAPLSLGDGPTVRVSGSVGIALFPDDGGEPERLLNRADIACFAAREHGQDGCLRYHPGLEEGPRERQDLLLALHEAIEQDQFTLAFMPKLRLADQRYAGAEVLVRWTSPSLGEVAPARFVPVAEDAGLIQGIGEWVLARTCAALDGWRAAGVDVGRLAINVSAAQLRRPDLVEQFAGLVERLGRRRPMLEIEVTESTLIASVEVAAGRLQQLRALGAVITLDDFGTGYSSFSHLKHLPIDALKIAPDFIADVCTDTAAARLVAAIIAMGRTLGLRVVAEGVETPAQAAFLAGHGCDEGQGYLFGRPMAGPQFEAWLAQRPR